MRKTIFAGAVGMAMGTAALAVPAHAADVSPTPIAHAGVMSGLVLSYHDDDDDDYWEHRRKAEKRYYKEQRKRAKHHARHHDRDYYDEPVYRDTRVWRGRDGRVYCRKRDGTTGLIVGGALGALLGREIDTRGDRTLGTVLGAAGGALLGREIERGRCR